MTMGGCSLYIGQKKTRVVGDFSQKLKTPSGAKEKLFKYKKSGQSKSFSSKKLGVHA